MKMLARQKYNIIGLGIIVLLFVISIFVRSENLKAPLSRHHEWITAHSLLTAEIWDENGGPSAYGFNPVYTFKGEGNGYNRMLGGITDQAGDTYYVSYPPFCYIYLHYVSQLTGGPSLFSARVAALSLHLTTAILLYFLIGAIRPSGENGTHNFPGVIAAGLYLFAQGNLWFHGNLFFADMVVQPLFVGGLLAAVHYFKGNYKREKLALLTLFLVFFLATYSEWIGLFSAFFTGLFFLVAAIIQKKKQFIRPFLVIGIGSALALGLTLYQYSSIDGWDAFKATSEKKYAERSGHGTTQDSAKHFNIHNKESFDIMIDNFNSNYKNVENFIGFGTILLLITFGLSRTRLSKEKSVNETGFVFTIILLIILPVLLHYILFFNFNSMHDFSGLKTGGALIIITGIIVQRVHYHAGGIHKYFQWSLLGFFTIFFIFKATNATQRYLEMNSTEMIDYDRVHSAETIAIYSQPDEAVFTNVRLSPEQVFYAGHNILPVKDNDTIAMLSILKLRKNNKARYYHHDGSLLKSVTSMEVRNNNLVFTDTLFFN